MKRTVVVAAPSKVGAAGWVRTRQCAERYAVAVDIEIAAEVPVGLELLGAHHLAAVVAARIVPAWLFKIL